MLPNAGRLWFACAAAVLACLSGAWGEPPPPDSDHDGLTDEEEARLGTNPGDPDTDDDGLLDVWEVRGYWSGGGFEPLPAYGANPLRKDVFVEIDWMASEGDSPQPNAVIAYQAAADVVRAFRRSGAGVEIHFDLGPRIASIVPPRLLEPDVDFSSFESESDAEKVIPYQERFSARPAPDAGPGSTNLSLYDAYFGGRFFRASRRNIFYYVIVAEQSQPPDEDAVVEGGRNHPYSDGFSDELARRDGLVSAGAQVGVIFRKPVADVAPELLRYQHAATLLHELGHAFGLGHGGALPNHRWNNTNWKPNYPSIMNYRYLFCGVDAAGGLPVMDFSHGALKSPLREKALLEPVGMGSVPSDHILECSDLRRLPIPAFPSNIDWNKDGLLTGTFVARDLNENGSIDDEALTDHDDWGKLKRDGFDGIGLNAFKGRGMSCGRGDDVLQAPGDFNGDGLLDLFLARGGQAVWVLSPGDGTLAAAPGANRREVAGGWSFQPGDSFLAGDFLGGGRDMIFTHRARETAIIDSSGADPRVAWYADDWISDGAQDPEHGWALGPSDRFLAVALSAPRVKDLVVTNGRDVAILSALPAGAAPAGAGPAGVDAVGAPAMVWTWSAGPDLQLWTHGDPAWVRAARRFSDGRESFFVLSASTLVEVAGPARSPTVAHIDLDGVIPPSPAAQAVPAGWRLASDDAIQAVDLDGDGAEELVLKGQQRLGVVRWDGDGEAKLVWVATGSIQGAWPMSREAKEERLYSGQFIAGGGEELLLSNGQTWVTLGWNAAASSLEILAINNRYLVDGAPGWELRRGQAVLPGRFLPRDEDVVLVEDDTSLFVAAFEIEGFRPLLRIDRAVGDWILQPDDLFLPAQLDLDRELEILARNGDRYGVLDLSPVPRSLDLARLDVDTLSFGGLPRFQRGDANGDGEADISDVVMVLGYLFLGFDPPRCKDAADADDDGTVNVSDPIYLLSFLFSGGKPIPPPGPFAPGIDPTSDELGCGE